MQNDYAIRVILARVQKLIAYNQYNMTDCTVFSNVDGNSYPPNKDIANNFEHNGERSPNSRDWVGLFRCGWTSIRDYHTFEWLPRPTDDDNVFGRKVVFSGRHLPHTDDGQSYEFCYIDRCGVLRGSSRPFVFTKANHNESIAVDVLEVVGPAVSTGELHAKGKRVYLFSHPAELKTSEDGINLNAESHEAENANGDVIKGRTRDASGSAFTNGEEETLVSMEMHAATFSDNIRQLEMGMRHLWEDNMLLRERVRSTEGELSALKKKLDDEKALRLMTEQQLLATQQELSSVRLFQTSPSLTRSFARPAVVDKNSVRDIISDSVYLPKPITTSGRSSPLARQCPFCKVNFPAHMLKTDVEGHVLTHLLIVMVTFCRHMNFSKRTLHEQV